VSSSECIDYFDETSTSLKHILCKHEKGELTYVPKLLFYPDISPFYFIEISPPFYIIASHPFYFIATFPSQVI